MKPLIAALLLATAWTPARAQGDTNPPPPPSDASNDQTGIAPITPHRWQADPVNEPAQPPAAVNKITDTGEINPNAGATPGLSVGPPITPPSANRTSGGGVNIDAPASGGNSYLDRLYNPNNKKSGDGSSAPGSGPDAGAAPPAGPGTAAPPSGGGPGSEGSVSYGSRAGGKGTFAPRSGPGASRGDGLSGRPRSRGITTIRQTQVNPTPIHGLSSHSPARKIVRPKKGAGSVPPPADLKPAR